MSSALAGWKFGAELCKAMGIDEKTVKHIGVDVPASGPVIITIERLLQDAEGLVLKTTLEQYTLTPHASMEVEPLVPEAKTPPTSTNPLAHGMTVGPSSSIAVGASLAFKACPACHEDHTALEVRALGPHMVPMKLDGQQYRVYVQCPTVDLPVLVRKVGQ